MLKEDLKEASQLEDIGFIKKVIVPLLHAEGKVQIRINIKSQKESVGIVTQPVFLDKNCTDGPNHGSSNSNINTKQYFIGSELMSNEMKAALEKKFVEIRKDKMPEVSQMVKSEWKMIYSQKKPADLAMPNLQYYWPTYGFKELCAACEGKSSLMILIKGRSGPSSHTSSNSPAEVLIGSYCNSTFPADMTSNWQHEFDYAIMQNECNFSFLYTENKFLHFENKFEKPFGYIYTDHEYGGALNIFGDFAMVSWSQDFNHSFGNVVDMNCLDDQHQDSSQWGSGSVELDPLEIQVWQYQSGIKLRQQSINAKKQFKLKSSYNKQSPLNYFSQNLIFEESTTKKLGHLLFDYLD